VGDDPDFVSSIVADPVNAITRFGWVSVGNFHSMRQLASDIASDDDDEVPQ